MGEKEMKSVGRKMSILMGVTLSFFLSLTGSVTSGHFVLPNWIFSFLLSTAVSLVIGFIVPMGKVGQIICRRLGAQPDEIMARVVKSLVSDLIYTPLITFLMVYYAYRTALSHGAKDISLLPMYLSSLMVCFIVGFVLIFILEPVYMNLLMKKTKSPGAD